MTGKTLSLVNAEPEEFIATRVPNFLRRNKDGFPIPVGNFSDDELRKVADAWFKDLLIVAEHQRKNKITGF